MLFRSPSSASEIATPRPSAPAASSGAAVSLSRAMADTPMDGAAESGSSFSGQYFSMGVYPGQVRGSLLFRLALTMCSRWQMAAASSDAGSGSQYPALPSASATGSEWYPVPDYEPATFYTWSFELNDWQYYQLTSDRSGWEPCAPVTREMVAAQVAARNQGHAAVGAAAAVAAAPGGSTASSAASASVSSSSASGASGSSATTPTVTAGARDGDGDTAMRPADAAKSASAQIKQGQKRKIGRAHV